MIEQRNALHKYAMLFGTYMGLFWIGKFVLFPIGLRIPLLLYVFVLLTVAVPFLGYYYARSYRDNVCGGAIGFLQAMAFTVFMFLFASLLVAVAHYVYFQFIDHGFVFDYYLNMMEEVKRLTDGSSDDFVKQLEEVTNALKEIDLSPINLTIQLISQNISYGMILAFPIALCVMKRPKPTEEA